VFRGEGPILLVLHEGNDDWQFLDGGHVDVPDGFVVHLHHVFDEHPEVRPLKDLPLEWAAERESPEGEWRRYPWPDEPEYLLSSHPAARASQVSTRPAEHCFARARLASVYDPSVGLSEAWLGVRLRDESQLDACRALVTKADLSLRQHSDGWQWARIPDYGRVPGDIKPHTSEISAAIGEPAIGGWVFDSDYGLLFGTDESGRLRFEFAVNAPWVPGENDEDEMLLHSLWDLPEGRRQSADALAAWSRSFAPRAVAAEELLRSMPGPLSDIEPKDGVYFETLHGNWWYEEDAEGEPYYAWSPAEGGIRFLIDSLGFGSIDQLAW
jgi:hypothetical protein